MSYSQLSYLTWIPDVRFKKTPDITANRYSVDNTYEDADAYVANTFRLHFSTASGNETYVYIT